jgi:hypothetical protein
MSLYAPIAVGFLSTHAGAVPGRGVGAVGNARGQFFDRLSAARRRENDHGSESGLAPVANT